MEPGVNIRSLEDRNRFDLLPDEVMIKIFWYFKPYEMKSIVSVSQRFSEIGQDPTFLGYYGRYDNRAQNLLKKMERKGWKKGNLTEEDKIVLKHAKFMISNNLFNKSLPFIQKHCQHLQNLGLNHGTNQSIRFLPKNLKTLVINKSGKITDEGVAQLANIKSLTSVNFFNSEKISDLAMIHFSKLDNLTALSLWDCPQITDISLPFLGKLERLSKLVLVGAPITDRGIAKSPWMKKLTILNLSNCKNLTDESLKTLQNFQQLESLNLSGNDHFTSESLITTLTKLTKLQTLKLTFSPGVDDNLLSHLAHCDHLEYLDIGSCAITNNGLRYLSESKGIKELKLNYCSEITDISLIYLAFMEKLERVDLRHCHGITEDGLSLLIKKKGIKILIQNQNII